MRVLPEFTSPHQCGGIVAFLSRILQIVYRITHETLILKKGFSPYAGTASVGWRGQLAGAPSVTLEVLHLFMPTSPLCYVAFGSGSGAARNIDLLWNVVRR